MACYTIEYVLHNIYISTTPGTNWRVKLYTQEQNKTNKTNETTRTKQTIIKHAISLQGSRACQVSTYHTDQRATIIILAGV